MKKVYVKPEMGFAAKRSFEQVYAGGCSNEPGGTGCGYGADWEQGHAGDYSSIFWYVLSDHQRLAPGYVPELGETSS